MKLRGLCIFNHVKAKGKFRTKRGPVCRGN